MTAQALAANPPTPHVSPQLRLDLSQPSPPTMLPQLVRVAITLYSNPGDLILDPSCGTGITLVEAIQLDRDAIGIEAEHHDLSLAAEYVCRARVQGAAGHAIVLREEGRRLGCGVLDELTGQVPLIISTHVECGHDCACPPLCSLRPRDRDSARSRSLLDLVVACRRLLAPRGILVVCSTTSPELLEVEDQTECVARDAGFELIDRLAAIPSDACGARIALRAGVHQVEERDLEPSAALAHDSARHFQEQATQHRSRVRLEQPWRLKASGAAGVMRRPVAVEPPFQAPDGIGARGVA